MTDSDFMYQENGYMFWTSADGPLTGNLYYGKIHFARPKTSGNEQGAMLTIRLEEPHKNLEDALAAARIEGVERAKKRDVKF